MNFIDSAAAFKNSSPADFDFPRARLRNNGNGRVNENSAVRNQAGIRRFLYFNRRSERYQLKIREFYIFRILHKIQLL